MIHEVMCPNGPIMDKKTSTWHLCLSVWVLFGLLIMFSNFYQLDLHNKIVLY